MEVLIMIIKKKICPDGLKNHPGLPLRSISFVTIHCTANYSAEASAAYYASAQFRGNSGKDVSWHYTVDNKEIWQSFDDHSRCWHAGDGPNGNGNATSIAIELCVNDQLTFLETCKKAAELTAKLLTKYKLPVACVVQHNTWSGKNCPRELISGEWGICWKDFLKLIKDYLERN